MRRLRTGPPAKLPWGAVPGDRRVLRGDFSAGDRRGVHARLARWLHTGSHRIVGWETDLSCQTGAAQAGILHGNNHNIPAFRWVEKANNNRVISSNGPKDSPLIEQRISDGNGLLARAGAARANLFSGNAQDDLMVYSTLTSLSQFYRPSYYVFFCQPLQLSAHDDAGSGRGAARTVGVPAADPAWCLAAHPRKAAWCLSVGARHCHHPPARHVGVYAGRRHLPGQGRRHLCHLLCLRRGGAPFRGGGPGRLHRTPRTG